MKIRLLALLLGALLLAVTPANAATLTSYAGRSTANALNLTIAGEGLTIGFTEAMVQSGPVEDGCADNQVACSQAAAVAGPFGETAQAFAPGGEGPVDATAFALPDPLSQILAADLGIAVAEASTSPSANGDAGVATLAVTLTQTLVENAPDLQDGLQEISDGLLGPIAEGDPTGEIGPRLKGALDFIIDNLDDAPLATVALGPSSSEAEEADGVVTAAAAARGAVIVISPTALSTVTGPEGLVIVEVGAANARATSDGGTADASFDPALVRVRIWDPVAQDYVALSVETGEEPVCVGEAPLVVCIGVGSGSVTIDGTSAAAVADGVAVRLFEDPLPQIVLELAHAEAGVTAAAPAAPVPPGPQPVTPAPALPRTGMGLALPAVAFMAAGGLSLAAIRRRRA